MINSVDERQIIRTVEAVLQRSANGRDRWLLRKALQRERERELEEVALYYRAEMMDDRS